jgi:hypothetical protein
MRMTPDLDAVSVLPPAAQEQKGEVRQREREREGREWERTKGKENERG